VNLRAIAATPPKDVGTAAEQDVQNLEDLLGSIWLHINWRHVTKQLTTIQKERFLAAVEAWSIRLDPNEPFDPSAWAWWRPGYVEPALDS
jgi:hypothetical protein